MLGTDYFLAQISELKQDREYFFTGIISENTDEFCEYSRHLTKSHYLTISDIVVFMGLTDEQAKTTAQWMISTFEDCFVDKTIYYWGISKKTEPAGRQFGRGRRTE